VTGGAGETFDAYAAKGYCVNKAGLLRCTKFLGLIGTMGNGQAVLLSKNDLETVWVELVSKQPVRFFYFFLRFACVGAPLPPLNPH
jgi:hypothetical protein